MAKKRSLFFWGGLGCLSLVLLCTGGGAAMMAGVFGALKHSGPYEEAVARARANPGATAALGTPIDTGWMVSGSVDGDVQGGHAALAIPVHGPKASGVIQVEGRRSGKAWSYSTLQLRIDGSHVIDLRDRAPAQDPAATRQSL